MNTTAKNKWWNSWMGSEASTSCYGTNSATTKSNMWWSLVTPTTQRKLIIGWRDSFDVSLSRKPCSQSADFSLITVLRTWCLNSIPSNGSDDSIINNRQSKFWYFMLYWWYIDLWASLLCRAGSDNRTAPPLLYSATSLSSTYYLGSIEQDTS